MLAGFGAPPRAFFRPRLVETRSKQCLLRRVPYFAVRPSPWRVFYVGADAGEPVSALRGFCSGSSGLPPRIDTQKTAGAFHRPTYLFERQQPCSFGFTYLQNSASYTTLSGPPLVEPLLGLLQHKHKLGRSHVQPSVRDALPLLPLETFDAYRRQIVHVVEQAVGPQRQSEFRSLRLVIRSMIGVHCTFLLFLLAAPPTSLELLLTPHAQFCCLCLAQSASMTFWGFGLARPGPLTSGGVAVGDWRLALGLLYFWICAVALTTTLKDPKTSYVMQILALSLLLFLQRRLGSSNVVAVPKWWINGSHQKMLLVLLSCMCLAFGRALYVERRHKSIMEGDLGD